MPRLLGEVWLPPIREARDTERETTEKHVWCARLAGRSHHGYDAASVMKRMMPSLGLELNDRITGVYGNKRNWCAVLAVH